MSTYIETRKGSWADVADIVAEPVAVKVRSAIAEESGETTCFVVVGGSRRNLILTVDDAATILSAEIMTAVRNAIPKPAKAKPAKAKASEDQAPSADAPDINALVAQAVAAALAAVGK